jgi:predicted outer membrane repeat protein
LTLSIVSAGSVAGTTFNDIQNEVNKPNVGTVDLTGGTTYTSSGNRIIIQNTGPIVISAPDPSNKATLDANFRSYIFNVNSTSTITFRNINFINGNSSVNPGGAILAHSTIIIENCTFSNNYAQSGAAIMMNPGATGSQIRDCNFTNNNGIYEHPSWGWGEGAALDTHADNTVIENCLFENNYAKNNGGALSSALGSNNEIINCTFINNTADNNAGAILIRDSTVKVENCTFINNSASYGSAIFNDQDSDLDIWDCVFTDNFVKTYDIIAPDYIVNQPDEIILEIYLVLGDNILDAIYNDNPGHVQINGTVAVELESSPNQNITLTFNGANITNTTDMNGIATFNIPTSTLTLGDYDYVVNYNKTTLYEGINKTAKITVDVGNPNNGSVPGTGQNPITGPITDIPTAYPPAPPYVPSYPPTTINNNPPTGIKDEFTHTGYVGQYIGLNTVPITAKTTKKIQKKNSKGKWVTVKSIGLKPSGQYRYHIKKGSKVTTQKININLLSTVDCNLKDPKLKKQAQKYKKYKNPITKVNKICEFVYTKTKHDDGKPLSASEAFKKRVTNCVGRANLAIALCRLSDVSSRYASKLIYDSKADKKIHTRSISHKAHVWTQVYVNKKWVSVEQTIYNKNTGPGYISTYNYGYSYYGGCNDKVNSAHVFGPTTVNGIKVKTMGVIP